MAGQPTRDEGDPGEAHRDRDPGESGRSGERTSGDITLTATGVTMLGVLVSVGTTVGFGIETDWWLRVLLGGGSAAVLFLLAAWATSTGRGPVAKLANRVIGRR